MVTAAGWTTRMSLLGLARRRRAARRRGAPFAPKVALAQRRQALRQRVTEAGIAAGKGDRLGVSESLLERTSCAGAILLGLQDVRLESPERELARAAPPLQRAVDRQQGFGVAP